MSALKRLFGSFRSAKSTVGKSESEPVSSVEWVVAGLGNPGEDYARSRHNAGFLTIDRIAKANHAELNRRKFKGVMTDLTLAGRAVTLVKPQTYYNLSGECVANLLGYFKIPAERLIVVHDEMDLEAGRLRIKRGGGDAGNRGVRSIAESLGSVEFIRVRIDIGHPIEVEENKDYLLRAMTADERRALLETVDRAASAVETIVATGLERAMNTYNQRS